MGITIVGQPEIVLPSSRYLSRTALSCNTPLGAPPPPLIFFCSRPLTSLMVSRLRSSVLTGRFFPAFLLSLFLVAITLCSFTSHRQLCPVIHCSLSRRPPSPFFVRGH